MDGWQQDLQIASDINSAPTIEALAKLEATLPPGAFGGDFKQLVEARRAQLLNEQNTAKMQEAAKEYRTNIQGKTDELATPGTDMARRNLAQTMSGVNAQANRRGLLYSGLRQSANAQAQGQYASGVSDARTRATEMGQQRASALEGKTIQSGFERQQGAMGAANDEYNDSLQRRQSSQALTGSIFNSAGSVAGGLLARRR